MYSRLPQTLVQYVPNFARGYSEFKLRSNVMMNIMQEVRFRPLLYRRNGLRIMYISLRVDFGIHQGIDPGVNMTVS